MIQPWWWIPIFKSRISFSISRRKNLKKRLIFYFVFGTIVIIMVLILVPIIRKITEISQCKQIYFSLLVGSSDTMSKLAIQLRSKNTAKSISNNGLILKVVDGVIKKVNKLFWSIILILKYFYVYFIYFLRKNNKIGCNTENHSKYHTLRKVTSNMPFIRKYS